MFETGDILVSRNRIEQIGKYGSVHSSYYAQQLWLTKYKSYTLNKKFINYMGATWFEFIDDNKQTIHFSLQQFERYFLSKREIRKLKLETIEKII